MAKDNKIFYIGSVGAVATVLFTLFGISATVFMLFVTIFVYLFLQQNEAIDQV